MPRYYVEHFTADDGDEWYSVVVSHRDHDYDVATGVMHATEAEASAELVTLVEED